LGVAVAQITDYYVFFFGVHVGYSAWAGIDAFAAGYAGFVVDEDGARLLAY
jgi:hypothetical protein